MYNGDPRIGLAVQRGSSEDFHVTFPAPLQLKLGTGRIVLFLRWGMGAPTQGQPGSSTRSAASLGNGQPIIQRHRANLGTLEKQSFSFKYLKILDKILFLYVGAGNGSHGLTYARQALLPLTDTSKGKRVLKVEVRVLSKVSRFKLNK